MARTCLALVIGGALGLAGACMQGLTRNPLADPGILGINAGASFAMVLAISFFGVSDLSAYIWFAFAGAAITMVAVHAIAAMGRDGATPVKLAIAGAALTAALSSWTSGVLLTDRATMESFRFWQVGTVGGRSFDVLLTGLPFLALGALWPSAASGCSTPWPSVMTWPAASAVTSRGTAWSWAWPACSWPVARRRWPGRSRSSA